MRFARIGKYAIGGLYGCTIAGGFAAGAVGGGQAAENVELRNEYAQYVAAAVGGIAGAGGGMMAAHYLEGLVKKIFSKKDEKIKNRNEE